MSHWPKPREVTVTWRAVMGPSVDLCTCGHPHYGWIGDRAGLAPQWTWCGDETCSCQLFRKATRP